MAGPGSFGFPFGFAFGIDFGVDAGFNAGKEKVFDVSNPAGGGGLIAAFFAGHDSFSTGWNPSAPDEESELEEDVSDSESEPAAD